MEDVDGESVPYRYGEGEMTPPHYCHYCGERVEFYDNGMNMELWKCISCERKQKVEGI